MSLPSEKPSQPLTAAQVREWIHNATVKRLALHVQAIEPLLPMRDQAFVEMEELCKAAIEHLGVVSTQLRKECQAACDQSAAILADAARLLEIFGGEQRHGETLA